MKNSQNNIPNITSDNLQSGALESWVPELYAQKNVIAINPWHDHQSIFSHTVKVLSSAEHIMTFPFIEEKLKGKLITYLAEKIDGVPRQTIVLTVNLLHDVGCASTLVIDAKTGQNSCPGHEAAGRDISIGICQRWGISDILIDRISTLIFRHLDIHKAMNKSLAGGNSEIVLNELQKSIGDTYLELLIQGYADVAGSDLPILEPKQFLLRENIYKEALTRFAASR